MIKENAIFDIDLKNQEDCFNFLVSQAYKTGIISDKESIKNDLIARENLMTTALLEPIAIPHAKSSKVNMTSIIFLRLKNHINWGDSYVKIVIGLFSKDGDSHIGLLSNISRKLVDENFRNFLLSGNKEEIYKKIQELGE